MPISIAKALSVASVGSDDKRGHKARVQDYGSCTSSAFADILETERTDTTPQSGPDRSKERGAGRLDRGQERCFGQLELDRVSARKKPTDKDRSLGRQCSPGLRMAQMDEADMAKADKWYPWTQTVAFRAHGIWSAVPESSRHDVRQGHSAVPVATLKSQHRHQQTTQNDGCNK